MGHRFLPALALAFILSACGGGSEPSTSNTSSLPGQVTATGVGLLGAVGEQSQLQCLIFNTGCSVAPGIYGYFVDGPTKGVAYTCAPSNTAGTTDGAGRFTCGAGDTSVSFSIPVGAAGSIQLGQAQLPAYSGISLPVTQLKIGTFSVGLKAAEILQALNHGTTANLDVGGIVLPAATLAQVNTYIATAGTLPAGQTDDGFLAGLQAQAVRPGIVFATPVTGNGTNFMFNTVLPHLQDTIVGISTANNVAAGAKNGVTYLTGTVLVSGSGQVQLPGCNTVNWSANGGGIMNATVQGDVGKAGSYAIHFQSPGFAMSLNIGDLSCPPLPTVPGTSEVTQVAPFGVDGTVGVTPAFIGYNLTIPLTGPLPAGCTGGSFTGTNVGRAQPLITLTTVINCDIGVGSTVNLTVTAKMVDPDPP